MSNLCSIPTRHHFRTPSDRHPTPHGCHVNTQSTRTPIQRTFGTREYIIFALCSNIHCENGRLVRERSPTYICLQPPPRPHSVSPTPPRPTSHLARDAARKFHAKFIQCMQINYAVKNDLIIRRHARGFGVLVCERHADGFHG